MSESSVLNVFLSGAIALAFALICIQFFGFWQQSRIRLFLLFAGAFFLLMIERIVLILCDPDKEVVPYVYAIRLAAFIVIIIAIIDQNRHRRDDTR
jgi:hypothetical protein